MRRVQMACTLSGLLLHAGCMFVNQPPPTSIPLVGSSVGRGRPVGAGILEVGASIGGPVELSGTLDAVHSATGAALNPIPPAEGPTTLAGVVDPVGFAYGLNDWLDVGLSFSRGVHAAIRVTGGDRWALSLHPAYVRHSSRSSDGSQDEEVFTNISNINLAGLVSVVPDLGDRGLLEVYLGGGVSRFQAALETEVDQTTHTGLVPAAMLGVRSGLSVPRRGSKLVWLFSVEGQAAVVTQRDRQRVIVPAVRIYFSTRGATRSEGG